MRLLLRAAVIVAALGAAFVPLPAAWVEALYSERAYLAIQRAATPLSNRVPFALFDLLILAGFAWLVFAFLGFVRRWRKAGPVASLGRFLVRLAAAVALVYLAFVVLWALNYRRVPLSARLAFSAERVTPEATAGLARTVVRRVNDLHPVAHRLGFPDFDRVVPLLQPSFAAVQQQLAGVTPAVAGRPKWSLLTYYFQRSGVDGMTDPFFLEVLLNQSLLPFERPFVTAHEWAHLAGYADESEANFVGWLVCLQAPPQAEYSAHLALLWQLLPALPRGERDALLTTLHAGPREDLRAIANRVAKTTPLVRRVSWRIYDRYLKANRVEKGVASYDAALELMIGTRFGPGWVPMRGGR